MAEKAAATPPDLSVVIPSYNASDTILDCLKSLGAQITTRRFEIIVVDSSSDETVAVVRKRFPGTRILSFAERKYCGDARNIGIAAASAPIIAFLDADCTVDNNWIECIMEAHEQTHELVGCAIVNGAPESLMAWAYYFCEFNLWFPWGGPREIPEVAGCALSMKRRIFEKYGPFLEGTYCSDTAMHWKLCRHGIQVLFVPSVKVYHTANCTLRSLLGHIYLHRRQFAHVSVHENQLSVLDRFARLVLCLPLPFILYVVITWRVLRARCVRKEFAASSPLVFAGLLARAAGEFAGFLRPHPSGKR